MRTMGCELAGVKVSWDYEDKNSQLSALTEIKHIGEVVFGNVNHFKDYCIHLCELGGWSLRKKTILKIFEN